jgi:hypothetical protein
MARAHQPLEAFAPEVWITHRGQRFYGLETGTRMTIVRLADGGLFVHGPITLDEATRAEVEALGPVRAIVASSLFHHLYAGQWSEAYPDALLCACPGLEKKRIDLPWQHILGDEPHPLWAGQIDQVYFSSRFEHEVVFFHRATRTLLCLDALINIGSHPSRVTRAVAWVMRNDGPGKGWAERIAVRNRQAAREQVDRVLAWDIDGIILAHGGLVRHGGREVFRDAYAWVPS